MEQVRNYSRKVIVSSVTSARKATYTLLGAFDRTILRSQNPIIILSYHTIAKDTYRYSVDPSMLKKQITWLAKRFDFITLQAIEDHIKGKKEITKPSVVLTFDDGYKDILGMKDFFIKKSITPALFIMSDTKKANWKEISTKRPLLSNKEITSLYKLGWEIGSHSATHANLATLDEKSLQEEIVLAKKNLEKSLGFKIKYFAYPRGKYNKSVLDYVAKAKFTMALTMDDGFISTKTNLLQVPRVGIDRTHSFSEFTTTFSPSVVRLRNAIKQSPVGRYL